MSQSSSSSTFPALFDAALQDYEDKIGSSLINHPLAKELQECDSVGSITAILEEQARIFREFRDHGKLVNSFKHLVDVLSSPFISTVFDQGTDLVVRPKGIPRCILLLIGILQPFPPAKAIFAGIAILLVVFLSSSDSVCISP
jgi:phage-related protein